MRTMKHRHFQLRLMDPPSNHRSCIAEVHRLHLVVEQNLVEQSLVVEQVKVAADTKWATAS